MDGWTCDYCGALIEEDGSCPCTEIVQTVSLNKPGILDSILE